MAALICSAAVATAPACIAMEGLSIGASGMAFAADMALGNRGDAALDLMSAIPSVGSLGVGLKAARYARVFGRTLRAGGNAARTWRQMMMWRSVGEEVKGVEFLGAHGLLME